MHFLAERFGFFLGDFLKKEVWANLMAPISPFNSPTFTICLHIYSIKVR